MYYIMFEDFDSGDVVWSGTIEYAPIIGDYVDIARMRYRVVYRVFKPEEMSLTVYISTRG